jgi:membrane-associated protein
MGLAIGMLAFFMFLNSSVMAPPSELICLAAGYWASTADFPLVLIVLIATVSNLAGTSLWYHLGIVHRRKVLNRGRNRAGRVVDRLFVLLTGRDVDYYLIRFERSGWILIVLLRLVPVARSIISYGAGQANMKYGTFYAGSFVGILVWCATWSWAGYFYGLNSDTASVVIVLLIFSIGSLAAWVIQRKYQL